MIGHLMCHSFLMELPLESYPGCAGFVLAKSFS
jgi:hypothetical protein